MLDIVIESPITKRVVRASTKHLDAETMRRCVIEVRVGGLESACAYLNSIGIWARVAQFNATGDHATFQLMPTGHWSDEITNKVAQSW